VSGARKLGRLRTSPARQHRRRRHVPAGERARAYLGTILPRSFLDQAFAAEFLAGRR
jgi:hypothetical protein